MFVYSIVENFLPNNLGGYLWILLAVLLLLKVNKDCKIIGENFGRHFFLILMFPLITGACWLLIWPGSLRLHLTGKSLKDSSGARIFRLSKK